MYFADLKPIARLYGVPAAEMDEMRRCAQALVRIWTERRLSSAEIRADADISEHRYREIIRAADGETVPMPRLREPVAV